MSSAFQNLPMAARTRPLAPCGRELAIAGTCRCLSYNFDLTHMNGREKCVRHSLSAKNRNAIRHKPAKLTLVVYSSAPQRFSRPSPATQS